MEKGTKINLKDKKDRTPLHSSAFDKNKNIVIEMCKRRLRDLLSKQDEDNQWKEISCELKKAQYPYIDDLKKELRDM